MGGDSPELCITGLDVVVVVISCHWWHQWKSATVEITRVAPTVVSALLLSSQTYYPNWRRIVVVEVYFS